LIRQLPGLYSVSQPFQLHLFALGGSSLDTLRQKSKKEKCFFDNFRESCNVLISQRKIFQKVVFFQVELAHKDLQEVQCGFLGQKAKIVEGRTWKAMTRPTKSLWTRITTPWRSM
jgi:hypothetical protein